jgi:hypothetical protein
MKLSEAIEAGARLRPQSFGYYFTGTARADACSCVFGAVYEVTYPDAPLSHDAVVTIFDTMADEYPLLNSLEKIFCPECAGDVVTHDNLTNIIIHLNDDHRWTRERIAEYVRRFEQ